MGDAAGYLDAITGEGLTLAFESAAALAEVITDAKPLGAYEMTYRRLSRTYYWMTALVLAVAARPGLRRRVVNALARGTRDSSIDSSPSTAANARRRPSVWAACCV